jgi:hypothetical protein
MEPESVLTANYVCNRFIKFALCVEEQEAGVHPDPGAAAGELGRRSRVPLRQRRQAVRLQTRPVQEQHRVRVPGIDFTKLYFSRKAGLPDFYRYNIPTRVKIYQRTVKSTKWT